MPASEFGDLATADVLQLFTNWETKERRTDLRFGVLASLAANMARGKDQQPYHPADFFESLEVMRGGPMTEEELVEKVNRALGMGGS